MLKSIQKNKIYICLLNKSGNSFYCYYAYINSINRRNLKLYTSVGKILVTVWRSNNYLR